MADHVPIKIACYTCITGNYENSQTVQFPNENVSFFLFSDQNIEVSFPWKLIRLSEELNFSNQDLQRFVKIQPHLFPELKGYDYLIYVDGNVEIIGNLTTFISSIGIEDTTIALFQHPVRNLVSEELKACAMYGHQHFIGLIKHFLFLKINDFKDEMGLYESGVFVWNMRNYNHYFSELWWKTYFNSAKRDQLALPFALQKIEISFKNIGCSNFRGNSEFFNLKPHLQKRPIKKRIYRLLNLPFWITSWNPTINPRN
jgi:hypothetical protein